MPFITHADEKHLHAAKTNLNSVTDVRHVTGQQTYYFLRHFHISSLCCIIYRKRVFFTPVVTNLLQLQPRGWLVGVLVVDLHLAYSVCILYCHVVQTPQYVPLVITLFTVVLEE